MYNNTNKREYIVKTVKNKAEFIAEKVLNLANYREFLM